MQTLLNAFSLSVLLYSALGVIVGIVFGAIPGLTGSMGIILLLPMTYSMSAGDSFALLLGIYCGSYFGGSITAILIKTPGTAAAAATALDGNAMARNGHPKKALHSAAWASFTGGIFSCVCLMTIAPQLAKIALKFGPAEYFMVGLFGISIVASIASGNLAKGLLSALVGLLISTIGMDPYNGVIRFGMGIYDLYAGFKTVPTLIGVFAIPEILVQCENVLRTHGNDMLQYNGSGENLTIKEYWSQKFNLLRSCAIGTVVGIIPATGATIAAWLSYNQARNSSKHPEKFGTGVLEGIFSCEAANNAVTGGALIPLLTLAVPGDTVTAILLGAFMIQGLTPGPLLFQQKPEIINGIYLDLLISNILMLIFGLLCVKLFVKILKVPPKVLLPIVLMFCLTGSFSVGLRLFDVCTSFAMGILCYAFRKVNVPATPILLGMLLGQMLEYNYLRALVVSKNGLMIFLTRPISLVLFIACIFSVSFPILRDHFKKKRAMPVEEP